MLLVGGFKSGARVMRQSGLQCTPDGGVQGQESCGRQHPAHKRDVLSQVVLVCQQQGAQRRRRVQAERDAAV